MCVCSALLSLAAAILGVPTVVFHSLMTTQTHKGTYLTARATPQTTQSSSVKDVFNPRRPRGPTCPTLQSLSLTDMPTYSKSDWLANVIDNIITSNKCDLFCDKKTFYTTWFGFIIFAYSYLLICKRNIHTCNFPKICRLLKIRCLQVRRSRTLFISDQFMHDQYW